jgi:hypothetical protein
MIGVQMAYVRSGLAEWDVPTTHNPYRGAMEFETIMRSSEKRARLNICQGVQC